MTKEENKDITLIKYNHLNLPTEIQFTNNRKINYVYDANGIKLKKEVNGKSGQIEPLIPDEIEQCKSSVKIDSICRLKLVFFS